MGLLQALKLPQPPGRNPAAEDGEDLAPFDFEPRSGSQKLQLGSGVDRHRHPQLHRLSTVSFPHEKACAE